ncbi:hypothetical protein L211DRAFT_849620 [Terfezia boudieri ATCC MYA-4762]|uniref:Uncharacterized protein n=1 Tax=Terfezia boudieri ATCC MYA-4762 TaxID=1051890 RepID=A0A3N4LL23_9PEZI|nr:hypothetical protein L211DRAFT_849620 [Terfezia boudieri ATCC MYA-4762]
MSVPAELDQNLSVPKVKAQALFEDSDRIAQFCNRLRAQSPQWKPSIQGMWDRRCDERYLDWNNERFNKGFIDFRELAQSDLQFEPLSSTPVDQIPLRLMAEFCLSQDIWLDEDLITEELAYELDVNYPFKKIFETSQAILSVIPERTQIDEGGCLWNFYIRLSPEEAFVEVMDADQADDEDDEEVDCDITSNTQDEGFTTGCICRKHLRIKVVLKRRNVKTQEVIEEYLTQEQYLGIIKQMMVLEIQELKALV